MPSISFEQSGAFIERFTLPPTRSGPLNGLTFAVKDLIDVAGHHTGCGNPTWRATHPPASVSAICVEQLLAAGARCEGKTITDEIAFSLLGENHFYGTPLNPAAPDRVPGGSSSGSASAVACGLVDFALGTDTGGSVRVPASNCGIFGLRPSHGHISVAGVMPLAPTLDTIGYFAREWDVLELVAGVLLFGDEQRDRPTQSGAIHLVREAFELADAEVRAALSPAVDRVREVFGRRVRETSLAEICNDDRAADPTTWLTIYRVLQGTEMMSCLGHWIEAEKPPFGPAPSAGLEFVKRHDRSRVGESIELREWLCRSLNAALSSGDLLCLPTAPTIAPRKSSKSYERTSDYYQRTLPLTAIAGVGRLPQISMPLANVNGAPIGLSLAAAYGADIYLLKTAAQLCSTAPGSAGGKSCAHG
jgi:amidase